jgi:hypothetical protein
MTWKRYQNELIVLIAFLFMLAAYGYKTAQVSSQAKNLAAAKHSVKRIWADTRISKKVEKLQTLVPASKIKWSNQNKKVTASYKQLTAAELNTVVTKILNVPVEIETLKIQKVASSYDVEFKCKW